MIHTRLITYLHQVIQLIQQFLTCTMNLCTAEYTRTYTNNMLLNIVHTSIYAYFIYIVYVRARARVCVLHF